MPESSDNRYRLSLRGFWSRLETTTKRVILLILAATFVFYIFGLMRSIGGWQAPRWDELPTAFVESLYGNVFSEALSILVTVLILDQLNQRREDTNRKQYLIDQMSSRVEGFAAEAIRLLKDHDKHLPEDAPNEDRWWDDQLVVEAVRRGGNLTLADLSASELIGVNLSRAKLVGADLHLSRLKNAILQGARLKDANLNGILLRNADLGWAELENANLIIARLDNANLSLANLKGASLTAATLEGADLTQAWLENADLCDAKMKEANLTMAYLKGAKGTTVKMLKDVASLEGAILPDGLRLPCRDYNDPYKPLPNWRIPFENWCDAVMVDEDGWIIPAPPDDEDE